MNWKILKEPYPFNNSLKKEIISSFFFGLFVFLFLFLFQPFGLSQYQSPTKTIELAGYGLITMVVLFFNNLTFTLIFPKWFNQSSWSVGKNIFYSSYMFFSIGLANLIYSVYQGYLSLNLKGFLLYQGITLLVGLFPFTVSTFAIYSNRLKKAIKEADHLNASLSPQHTSVQNYFEIPSQNKSENLSIDINALLAIKAIENYIEIYSLKNGMVSKTIIRNTLKNIEEAFSGFDFIKKCHRSYLVNLQNVEQFSGNAQGLTLDFGKENSIEVLVSRSFVKEIKMYLTGK